MVIVSDYAGDRTGAAIAVSRCSSLAIAPAAIDRSIASNSEAPGTDIREDRSGTIVEAMDPRAVLGLVDSEAIGPVALEARERLERVIASLATD